MVGVGGARLLYDVVVAIHFIMPGTTVPVVGADEVENAGAERVQSHVLIICKLVKEMAGVCGFIPTGAVVSRAHVGADANALVWPAVPFAIGIHGDGYCYRMVISMT